MRTTTSHTGAVMPVLGQGTYAMGADRSRRGEELRALRLGLDLGMTLVDTAEMYANGGAEEVVGEAIAGRRDEVFLVSKVLPGNASRDGTLRAAERSLRRLGTDRIDLYLLHWKSRHPLEGTLSAFHTLRDQGKILHFGVSNFDTPDLERALALPGGEGIAANQVLYHVGSRGIERTLLPFCRERGIAVMAYSPLLVGRIPASDALREVAERHGATPAQIALAFPLRVPHVVAVPKSSRPAHVRDNAAAAGIVLTPEDLADLDRDHPAPDHDVPLDTA